MKQSSHRKYSIALPLTRTPQKSSSVMIFFTDFFEGFTKAYLQSLQCPYKQSNSQANKLKVFTMLFLIILAITQGITEFLPISSSGHLLLLHNWIEPAQTPAAIRKALVMDIAVHVGTLFSVLLYYYKDVLAMTQGGLQFLKGDFKAPQSRLGQYVLLASIPVILAGLIIHELDLTILRAPEIIAWTTLIFGILLWVTDDICADEKSLHQMTYRQAFLIGLSQILALLPGTSRSGITMTSARALGFSRTESARFSLLLAIIAILGAGTLGGLSLYKSDDLTLTIDAGIAALLSFISGYISIYLMIHWLQKASFRIFAIYRIILGVLLLGFFYFPW